MILFFAEEINGEMAYLVESEAIHCRQALRKNIGDCIYITDGNGHAFEAVITEMGKKRIAAKIISNIILSPSPAYKIHLAIAPTKNISRLEWLLEKATEIGIDEITPLLCERSERKIIKPERLNKILISAMKQSLKSRIPLLNPLIKFDEFVHKHQNVQMFIAHLDDDSNPIVHSYSKEEDVTILIGPEGDFSEREIELAVNAGYRKTSLGDYRLRTETAGLIAIQSIHLLNAM
jgi:16S rRNA (uracil1498-N3)-methyltransferase